MKKAAELFINALVRFSLVPALAAHLSIRQFAGNNTPVSWPNTVDDLLF